MLPFTPGEQSTIENAINRAEKNTSGEIVVVVAVESAGYFASALMWAALVALLVPWPLIYLTDWPVEFLYLAQLGVFLLGALLMQWQTLRFAIVPKSVKRARAHQKAVEQFIAQNLHTTKGRTGVLIYVSFAERYAEVIADEGIYKKVPQDTWNGLIEILTTHLGRGQRVEGFVHAIDACGKILASHFPPGRIDRNELPNHLIMLDARWTA